MTKQAIYITGANGFIGQHLVDHLASKGREVYALLRQGSLPRFALQSGVHVVYGDMTEPKSLIATIPQGAVVINLAANPYHKILSYLVNVEGTRNLIGACKVKRASLLVQISSQSTRIARQGVYAKTKNLSDELVRQSGRPYVILKPSLVYGQGERGLFNKIKQLSAKLPVVPVFGDGLAPLYPIEVGDFAELVWRIINDPDARAKEFDIGSSKRVTYNELYRQIVGDKLIHIPVWLGLLLAKGLSVLPRPPISVDNVLGSTQYAQFDPHPILKRYTYKPITFREGIRQVLNPRLVRVGMVGLGKMGTLHLSILNTFPDVEIAALIDTNASLYKSVQSMGIKGNFYTSLEEALRHERLDAIFIVTPTFTHYGLITLALKHDLHIFVEKPVSLNKSELLALGKLKLSRVVHTGYTLLNNRIYREVKRLLEDRTYGKILSFTGEFCHGEVMGPKKGWMFNKKLSGGGVLMNPGPHFFSLLNYWFGQPTSVQAQIQTIYSTGLDDEVRATLGYRGFAGKVELSWSKAGVEIATNTFEIQLERAKLWTDGSSILVKTKGGKHKISLADIESRYEEVFDLNPKANGEAYYVENRSFIDAVQGERQRVPNDLANALATEATIYQVYAAGGLN